MEFRELRYFVALAEELHFARAAARVGIEQSPLSRAISDMERRLGVQLFIRTRRSTTLTPIGEMLLNDARRILAEMEHIRLNIVAAVSGRKGRLRVAVSDGVAHPRISTLLSETRQNDPDIELHVVHIPLREQLRTLRSGLIDVGFGLSPSSDTEVRSIPLWNDALVLVLRPDDQSTASLDSKQIERVASLLFLLGEPLAMDSKPSDTSLLSWARNCERIEYLASIELLLTLVAAGYGRGIIGAAQAETIRRPDIVVRPLNVTGAQYTTFMLQRSEGASSVAARFIARAQNMV